MVSKFAAALLIVLAASYAAYNFSRGKSELAMPVSAKEALKIVESNKKAEEFIKNNFFNESARITKVALVWDSKKDSYVWEVELMERECGCRKGIEGLNVLEAKVDPHTGKILNITTRVGIKEEVLARESCMKGCH